jgi:monoamine oxidase
MPGDDIEVAIIGGGAAGLAAGRRLQDAGVSCLILEARSRLGGRAWTITDRSGHRLDLGCGWLHSADRNPWRRIAEQQGRQFDKTPPPWMRPSLPIGFPLSEQRDAIAALQAFYARAHAAGAQDPDAPAATLLEPACRWNRLIGAVMTYVTGAELDRLSLRDFADYADTGVNWRLVDGYGTMIVAYGASLPVKLDCAVQRIDHRGKRLNIETTGGTMVADRAIVAVPTAVLAEERLLFTPALPAKTEAAAGLPLGLADKLFLSFDGANEFENDSRLFGRTDRTGTGVYHFGPFGRPQIEVYFGGNLADELEAAGETAFFDFARSELVALLGGDFARRIAPIDLHAWRGDPFARGSYSYALPGHAGCRAALAASVEDRLFFAGEACSAHDFSTAHGAWETGVAAAEAAIAARSRMAHA